MNRNIDTIFFDVGATLRYVVEDREFSAAADRALMELVGAQEPFSMTAIVRFWKLRSVRCSINCFIKGKMSIL